MRGNEKVSPQKIKNAPGVPSTEGITQNLGDTKWGESKLEESAYLLYQISPRNTRGESYAMQKMPFRSARRS